MNTQIIKKDGNPLFVIVPYDEYLQFIKPEKKIYFPHEVVEKSMVEEKGLFAPGGNIRHFPGCNGKTHEESPNPPIRRWKGQMQSYARKHTCPDRCNDLDIRTTTYEEKLRFSV
ncbi:MAG: hypothetical protein R2875_07090 [Desulfobacterales bacterium]